MREGPGNGEYTPLTPSIALDYLVFKKEYEGDDFLSVRNNVIGNWFDEQGLCDEINALRSKRIDFATIDGREAFERAFNEVLWKKIEHNDRLDKKEFKSLIGTLMHAVKKTEKLTENGKKNIADVLNEKLQEKEVKKQKKQERITKKQRDESDAQQKEEERIMQEMIVDSILNTIFSDLRTDKENTKSVGEKLTREELEDIFTEAWKQFLEQKPWLSKKKLDEIRNKFYINNVY